MQITTLNKAIKVTVDGPREPRSKLRHQGFHPFAFGPQRFPPDPLMGGLQFKLPGMILFQIHLLLMTPILIKSSYSLCLSYSSNVKSR